MNRAVKVLWFEVTEPSGYRNEGAVIGGWQDSLELIVRKDAKIELCIAFNGGENCEEKVSHGVTYIPIACKLSSIDKVRSFFSGDVVSNKLVKGSLDVIRKVNPDIIHVFGLEWPWGLVAEYSNIPIVIHIMGSIIPYWNAFYPPNYNSITVYKGVFPNLKKMIGCFMQRYYYKDLIRQEYRIWKLVHNYMGRTCWDYSLSKVQNSSSRYWHVEEAIRPIFLDKEACWKYNDESGIQIISIGCSSFWKGPDMLLKTAKILKANGVRFTWKIAGNMNFYVKKTVEKNEKSLFKDNNIEILGFTKPEDLVNILCSSSVYVHTAYIENSPNSICEAQCLGLPVIATNVGGVSSIVKHNVDGILVPANDPYQMASNIIELTSDRDRLMMYSCNARASAHKRHNPNSIVKQLFECYNAIINY